AIDADTVTFERLNAYSERSDAVVAVRADVDTRRELTVDDTYIIAYTAVISHPQRREEKRLDPDGPRVVTLRGFDSAALFESTDSVRLLFANLGVDPGAELAIRYVDALIETLDSEDARTRTLAVGELFLRESLRESIDRPRARRIGRALEDPDLSDALKSYLIETLAALPAERTAGWLAPTLRPLIDGAGTHYDLGSHRPRLVSEAVQALTPEAGKQDRKRLVALLTANGPKVVEAAIAALEKIDAGFAVQSVSETLDAAQWNDSLTAPVRRILEAYRVASLTAPAD
ncbi:MAG: hypothetical protein AAGD86_07040, partial [Pseudomonadota bacterium]